MRVDLFDFALPDDLIAQRPVSPRDSARLLDVTGDSLDCRAIDGVSSSIALWRDALERAN